MEDKKCLICIFIYLEVKKWGKWLVIEEVKRNYLDIYSLQDLKEGMKPSDDYSLSLIDPINLTPYISAQVEDPKTLAKPFVIPIKPKNTNDENGLLK